MDEFLSKFEMYFHPLMEVNYKFIRDEKMVPRRTIKILTYNIFLRPPLIKNNENDWKDERMADFIKILDCFDIICLQEIFGTFNNRKQELIKYANKSGLFFYCDSPSPSFFSKCLVDGGLLILSRFPIVYSEFRPFNYSVLSDSIAQKGIQFAKIKIGDNFLFIFNTHLQASYFGGSNYQWDISVKTRLDHIGEVCQFLNEVLNNFVIKNEDKVILVGDFNVDAHNFEKKRKSLSTKYQIEEEYKILMQKLNEVAYAKDIFKLHHQFHPYTFGYNGENLKHYDQVLTAKEDVGAFQTLDYIFEILPYENTRINNRKNHDDNITNTKANNLNNSYLQVADDNAIVVHEKERNSIFVNDSSRSDTASSQVMKLTVDYPSSTVQYFLVKDKPYQQLSDHFGLSVDLVNL